MSYYVNPGDTLKVQYNGDIVHMRYVTNDIELKFYDLFDRLGDADDYVTVDKPKRKKLSSVFRDATDWIDLFIEKIVTANGEEVDIKRIKTGKKMDLFGLIQDNLSELSGLDITETKN